MMMSAAALVLHLFVFYLGAVAELRDVCVHRLAARLVAEEVFYLVVHIDESGVAIRCLACLVERGDFIVGGPYTNYNRVRKIC